jgi:hypothetical protein
MMMEQKPHFNDLHLESYHCLVHVIIMLILVFFGQSLVDRWNHVLVICNVPRGNITGSSCLRAWCHISEMLPSMFHGFRYVFRFFLGDR